MKKSAISLLLFACFATSASAQEERKTPYWASITAGKAMMRTGPGRNYPGTFLYQRADLPIKVLEVYPSWRKVQDPDGTTGWMLVHLLSDRRTALITGEGTRPIHDKPDASSAIRYRAEPGVVGRISKCDDGWCRIDVKGKQGFIRVSHFWGTDPGEAID
ncbi:SH3 domain-containing protein [Allosphingosinicella vermicomposti]|uniref:SH3 domain-containing protein n=1 Tax=Allosphingosinicella vermicomposti TaxID=614671 RepID=UPI000D0E696B|nr:SH3 domain-containing protein [Allosphingosinicella vermicomposti]